MTRVIATILVALFVPCAVTGLAARAAEVKDDANSTPAAATEALYRSAAVVTGTRLETRLPGFAQCLGDVLVKVWRRIAFSASNRPFDLNGRANAASTIQTSASITSDARRFACALNQVEVFGTHR